MSTAIDAIRARRRKTPSGPSVPAWRPEREPPIPAPAGDTPQGQMEGLELRRTIARAIERLDPNRRRVVKLHLAGLSLGETARFLTWSEPKVRHLLYRGLENLRTDLRREGLGGDAERRETARISVQE